MTIADLITILSNLGVSTDTPVLIGHPSDTYEVGGIEETTFDGQRVVVINVVESL